MLFELLVLSGAQVGSDWTSILKKRQDFRWSLTSVFPNQQQSTIIVVVPRLTKFNVHRDAFSGFEAETVANFTEKQMTTISSEYGIDISRVRGVVDNSNRILEVINYSFIFNQFTLLLSKGISKNNFLVLDLCVCTYVRLVVSLLLILLLLLLCEKLVMRISLQVSCSQSPLEAWTRFMYRPHITHENIKGKCENTLSFPK